MTAPLIYYINLDSRTDRRDFMSRQLELKGLTATRVSAVTAREAAEARGGLKYVPESYADVEVACNLSHLKAWQLLIESGQEAAIILEDDAVLGPGFETLVDWDLYKASKPAVVRFETFRRPVRLASKRVQLGHGFSACRTISSQAGAAAYLLSRKSAIRAFQDARLYSRLVDDYLFGDRGRFLRSKGVLQVVPAPCVQAFKLDQFASSSIVSSDLDTERQIRYMASSGKRHNFLSVFRLQLKKMSWLLQDPAVLLMKKQPIPFSGDVALINAR